MNQSKHETYSSKNNTSMYELTLKLKHKSKTQAKQCKNYPKNYHKLFMISRAYGKKMTLRKLTKTCFNK